MAMGQRMEAHGFASRPSGQAGPARAWRAAPRISAPGDAAERDADRAADEALRRLDASPAATGRSPHVEVAHAPPAVMRQADEERSEAAEPFLEEPEEQPEEEDEIAAKRRSNAPPAAPPDFLSEVRTSGPGRPLAPEVRDRMESGFGRPFDRVRVHADAGSARLADAIDARAFAHGSHVFFGAGEYAPGTGAGDRLLAHEIAHTLQQPPTASVQRSPKKKKKKGKQRTPYEPRTMTDEEKIRLRMQLHEDVLYDLQEERRRFNAGEVKGDDKEEKALRKAADDAITAAAGIADERQRKVRTAWLRQFRKRMDDPFFAYAFSAGGYYVEGGTRRLHDIGNKDKKISANGLTALEASASALQAGVDTALVYISERALYEALGIDPSELQTAERAEGEGTSVLGAGPPGTAPPAGTAGGGLGGGSLEDRKVLEEAHTTLADLGAETATGDSELLAHELKKLTAEQRRDFFEFVRTMTEKAGEGAAEKTVTELLDLFNQLDPAEREALRVNREIAEAGAEATDTLSETVLLKLQQDVEPPKNAAEAAEQIQSNLDLIRSMTTDPDAKKELSGVDFRMAPFFHEMAMLLGLLAGGGSRSELVRQVGTELIKEIVAFREKLERELIELGVELAAWTAFTIITDGAAAPGYLLALRRLKKVKDLIDTLQRIYNVYNRVKRVIDLVAGAGQAYADFRAWFEGASARYAALQKQLESLEGGEDLEEALEAQEEKLIEELDKQLEGRLGELLEMMYIPEDTPPEELRNILFDIPRGITALEGMWNYYRTGDSSKEHFADVLAIKAAEAGRYLYPLVGLTAALVAEELQAAFPQRTVEDRVNRLISKKKRGPGLGQRNRGLFGRLRRKNVEYDDAALRPHLLKAKESLRKKIDDDEPGAGTSEHWVPAWFRYTVRREIKAVNKEFRGTTVEAVRKTGSGRGATRTRETVPLPPFRVRVKRPARGARNLTAEIRINPKESLEVDRLSPDDFKSGVEFGGTTPKRQDAIRNYLRDAGYELSKDPAGGEHIRLPHADRERKNRPYLHLDSAGKIRTGIDKTAYRRFLGHVVTDSRDLPEGYYAVHLKGEDTVSLKKGLAKQGHQKLGLDANHTLIEGEGAAPPKEVAKPGITNATASETFDYTASLDAMFEPKQAGAPEWNLQNRNRAAWNRVVEKEPELRKRPKAAKGRLGYIVRARAFGDALGSRHLPELQTADDKGHLIAKRFGGVDDYGNLVPMLRRQNQFPGKWYAFESDMAAVYVGKKAQPGHYVDFDLTLIYPSNRTRRPNKLVAKYQEKDASDRTVGSAMTRSVDND
jgi:hypothetical protein